MKTNEKGLLKQLMYPMVAAMAGSILLLICIIGVLFFVLYGRQVLYQNQVLSIIASENVGLFMHGADALINTLANHPDIVSMDGRRQTMLINDCKNNYRYIESIYIQGLSGMQTAHTSGKLSNRSDRWWFQQILQTKTPFISHMYFSVASSMPCVSLFCPIFSGGALVGVLGMDIKINHLQNMVREISDADTGRIFLIIDNEGNVVAHPNDKYASSIYNFKTMTKRTPNQTGVKTEAYIDIPDINESIELSTSFYDMIIKATGGSEGTTEVKDADFGDSTADCYASYSPVWMSNTSDPWAVISLYRYNAAMKVIIIIVGVCILVSALLLIGYAVVIYFISKKFFNGVQLVCNALDEAATGNYSLCLDETDDTGMQELAKSCNKVIANIAGLIHDVNRCSREINKNTLFLHQAIKDKNMIGITKSAANISELEEELAKAISGFRSSE